MNYARFNTRSSWPRHWVTSLGRCFCSTTAVGLPSVWVANCGRTLALATTRPARPAEVEGTDYFFVSDQRFEEIISDNGMLEHAQVFGNRYGTPREPVEAAMNRGKDVLFDVDWQGAQQLRASSLGRKAAARSRKMSSTGYGAPLPSIPLSLLILRRKSLVTGQPRKQFLHRCNESCSRIRSLLLVLQQRMARSGIRS